jgi:hypothetical protein
MQALALARRAFALSPFALFALACASGPAQPEAKAPEAAGSAAPKSDAPPGPPSKTLEEHEKDFISGCSAKVPDAPAYCACAWGEMKKLFTVKDMNEAGSDDPRFTEFKARVETTCVAKLPEPRIVAEYTEGCAGGEPRLNTYCECTWTEFRKTFSTAEFLDPEVRKGPRFTAAKKGAVKACSAKMPEDVARGRFMKACLTADSFKPFCDCVWKTVRAEVSAADIEAGLVDLEAARPKMDKACGKLRPAK